jgi:hypothetical protein
VRRSKLMLTIIAVLFGALCVFLLLKGSGSGQATQVLRYWLDALIAIPAVISISMIILDPSIGNVDETGILMKSWGIGRIAWTDIESYSVDDPGEGGRIISLHLRNEHHYLSKANQLKRQMVRLRRSFGLGPFVIYESNVNQPLDKLVAEIGRRVSVRARVA